MIKKPQTPEPVQMLDPQKIGNFHLQQEIYGASPPDPDFVENIRKYNILEPLIVTRIDGKLVSVAGHRRKFAARIAGIKLVPCIVREGMTEAEMQVLFLSSNKQREKTTEEKLREAKAWEAIFAEQAAENVRKGTPVSRDTGVGRAAEKAGEMVGLSASTVARGESVIEAIDAAQAAGDHEAAEEIRETVNTAGVAVAARKVAPKVKASDLRDQAGVPVPDELASTFKLAASLTGLVQSIGRLSSQVEQTFDGTSGIGDLKVDKVTDYLNRAQAEIKLNRPFCVCPACDGKKACSRCDGRKWLTKRQHENLTPALAEKLEAMK
jgi:ParB-like chromosome segregation protein Spo0J